MAGAGEDPRRWWALGVLVLSVLVLTFENTILTVAIPTIMADLDTDLSSLQWVLTGYALTFASLLVIGGRLGDLFGHRRTFVAGAALFALGSLVASSATSVAGLLVGEALIQGAGAALMSPATLAILSRTFHGRERGTAFAAWGAVAGAGVAFGPVIGGWLTTEHSWRWAFRINLVIIPLAIAGVLALVRRDGPDRPAGASPWSRIDLPGAALVATGTFLLVFALSEGGAHGWLTALDDLALGPLTWPASWRISVVPVAVAAAVAALAAFVVVERARERTGRHPLLELGQLRHLRFRYGLVTTMLLAVGQSGLVLILSVFLQESRGLSATTTGLWLVVPGLLIVAGAQVGGWLTRTVRTTTVVRVGMSLEALGLLVLGLTTTTGTTLASALPGLVTYSVGLGLANSQVLNVILVDIPADHAGAASGATSTVRQVGTALGVSVIGSVLTTQTVAHATRALPGVGLAPEVEAAAAAGLADGGANVAAVLARVPGVEAVVRPVVEAAVADASRWAFLFVAAVVAVGTAVSLLIPRSEPPERRAARGPASAQPPPSSAVPGPGGATRSMTRVRPSS